MRRRSSRRATASRRQRSARGRSWSCRYRFPSRCAGWSRARSKRARCTPSRSTASCTCGSTRTLHGTGTWRPPTTTRCWSTGAISCARRRSRSSTIPSSTGTRRSSCSAPDARSGSTPCHRTRRCGASTSRIIPSPSSAGTARAHSAVRPTRSWTRSSSTTRAGACSSAPTPITASAGVAADVPLLRARGVTKLYGTRVGCRDVGLDLWPGEVLGIVGESGSGKTTLLGCLSGRLVPTSGSVEFTLRDGTVVDVLQMPEPALRKLARTDWGVVHQNPRDGLRAGVTAGANVGERLMALGARHYGRIRAEALDWLDRVEIDPERIDDWPETFSSGMQQRLQIARTLVTRPRLVFMDEPTGGLDVSVQARLLDLVRGLTADLGLSAIIVTHDLAVTRLLAHRLLVMRGGEVVESGLTDQVLDDPQHPYTQLLVSSVLQP